MRTFRTFQNVQNGRRTNMSFTIQNKKQNIISFLEVQIIREETFTM